MSKPTRDFVNNQTGLQLKASTTLEGNSNSGAFE
jgi:hypothetical protein